MRDAVKDDMTEIVDGSWHGNVTEVTMASFAAKVDICDLGDKNRIFNWFMEEVQPAISQAARKEAYETEYTTNVKPIGRLLV